MEQFNSMNRILTITPNPAIDLSASVERVEPTRKLRCQDMRRDAGGGGINAARVARRLGANVSAIYTTGGAMGRLLRKLVDEEEITSLTIRVREQTREDFTVLETATGQQYRFVMAGSHLSKAEWSNCIATFDSHAGDTDLIVASGSLPSGGPDNFYARIAEIAQSRQVRMLLDVSGPPLRSALAQGVYLMKPNLRELRELVGASLDDDASRMRACVQLIADGRAEVVALTLGEQGALLVTADGAWRAAPVAIKPLSAVGTGDSFVGAMAWALSLQKPLLEAFRYGCAAGAAAVLTPGTELAQATDVLRLIDQISISPLGKDGRVGHY